MSENKNFQILSLSGGGFLGLYTISVLEKIEKDLGKPIAQCFDLIAGTSIGGIIALALAAEVPVSEIKKAFEKNGNKIFSNKPKLKGKQKIFDLVWHCFSAKYNVKALKNTIISIVGEDTKIADLKHAVIVPSVNMTKGSTQLFKTPHHESFKRDLHLKVTDVALATSAAPTYFPLAEIDNQLFADGGLYLNSPDVAALHEAEIFFEIKNSNNIKMLSIGTTTSQFSLSHRIGKNLGALQWMTGERLISTIISSQQINSDFLMRHKLGDQYLRIDKILSGDQEQDLGLDIATPEAIKTINGVAEGSYQENINNNTLKEILSHAKKPNSFYNKK